MGLGEGLAGQLLAFQANKPILDRILKEAGFTGDANAVESLLAGVTAKPDGKALPEPQSKPIIAGGANSAADGAKRGAP